jgi:hypothetical protein
MIVNSSQHPLDDELLSAYLDGELSEAERVRVDQLLAERPDYRQVLEELKEIRGAVKSLPKYALDETFAARVLRRAEREMLLGGPLSGGKRRATSLRPRRRIILWRLAALAATLLVILAVPAWLSKRQVAQGPARLRQSVAPTASRPADQAAGEQQMRPLAHSALETDDMEKSSGGTAGGLKAEFATPQGGTAAGRALRDAPADDSQRGRLGTYSRQDETAGSANESDRTLGQANRMPAEREAKERRLMPDFEESEQPAEKEEPATEPRVASDQTDRTGRQLPWDVEVRAEVDSPRRIEQLLASHGVVVLPDAEAARRAKTVLAGKRIREEEQRVATRERLANSLNDVARSRPYTADQWVVFVSCEVDRGQRLLEDIKNVVRNAKFQEVHVLGLPLRSLDAMAAQAGSTPTLAEETKTDRFRKPDSTPQPSDHQSVREEPGDRDALDVLSKHLARADRAWACWLDPGERRPGDSRHEAAETAVEGMAAGDIDRFAAAIEKLDGTRVDSSSGPARREQNAQTLDQAGVDQPEQLGHAEPWPAPEGRAARLGILLILEPTGPE